MPEDTFKLNSKFYWDNIVFKVEDELFCVPRSEFVQSSEVFADMFLLPSGPAGHCEGQDKEHPIVLEGYKKDEFMCLLKVMYPTAGSLISGPKFDLCLEKEEWVSVLKLSTIWNMTKVRNYAIHRLSTDIALSPVEKILLARAHKVAAWLEEGVTNLASGDPSLTLEDLAALGWETAARILWINLKDTSNANAFRFGSDAIKCEYCLSSASLRFECHVHVINENAVPENRELTFHGSGSPSGIVPIHGIICNCGGRAFYSIYCRSCSRNINNVRITPNKQMITLNMKEMIDEIFGREIEDYKLTMTGA